MSMGSHLKTFKSTAHIFPTVSAMTLKASTVVNRTAMHEVLVGVNHSREEVFADVGVPLRSSCSPDELVTVVDGQTSGERMHSPEMTLNSFFEEKLMVRERDEDTDDPHVDENKLVKSET